MREWTPWCEPCQSPVAWPVMPGFTHGACGSRCISRYYFADDLADGEPVILGRVLTVRT